MKAVILYQSKTGTTKRYAEQTKSYLTKKGIDVILSPIRSYNAEMLNDTDYLFLGCWTSGLFFFLQHPDKDWVGFSKKLTKKNNAKIALFTTYKLLTGSMFRNMSKHLKNFGTPINLELKSKDGQLSEKDKMKIDSFLG